MADNKPPVVSADTDISGKKQRKVKEPKKANYNEILSLVSGLDFNDRVELAKELKRMIHGELSDMQTRAAKASEVVKDLNL